LVNSFEEEFSENTLSELKKNVASNMSQSVVALASFIGTFTISSFTFGIIFYNFITKLCE
jgi:hypothetical protein